MSFPIAEEGQDLLSTSTHSYFTPMVDMLAGIVFILVIMLAATTLVSRSDFDEGAQAQAEIARIRAELAALKQIDENVLSPRRQAEAARRQLVERLADALTRNGFSVMADASSGRIIVDGESFFDAGNPVPNEQGRRFATVFAQEGIKNLQCLGGAPASEYGSDCAAFSNVRLDSAVIGYASSNVDANVADARALALFSSAASTSPALLQLRAVDGERLTSYRGLPASEARSESNEAGTAKAAKETIVLDFHMNVPPLPQ